MYSLTTNKILNLPAKLTPKAECKSIVCHSEDIQIKFG